MNPKRPSWKWIFGLSIDEDLRWAATRVETSEGYYSEVLDHHQKGYFCALPFTEKAIDLQELIRSHLAVLKDSSSFAFGDIEAIGISTIGVVHTDTNRLMNIDRKNWVRQPDGSIVNFGELLPEFFANRTLKIVVQNDATAKSLAEYHWQSRVANPDLPAVKTLFYASFYDGVNGGFVRGTERASDPVARHMHQELGHIFPTPHPSDLNFNQAHCGCLVHSGCFVALASGGRIKRQWGRDMPTLPPNAILRAVKNHRDNPWDIISHYIAHFCWNAVLTIPPQRILLGGTVVFDKLLERIRMKFEEINTYRKKPYIAYDELNDPNFISLALFDANAAGVAGALEVARLNLWVRPKIVPQR